MLSNSNPVSKLYASIIDDVIESVRELFQDEGVEERVLEDLRKLWETKVMQSKAVEGFLKDTLNPSNFVLQLPASYVQALHKPTASIIIPAGQGGQGFSGTPQNNSNTLATISLPSGVSYPLQIPAGVTLQTSSGHLYKVNVPVMVTQGPTRGHRIMTQPIQHAAEQRDLHGPQGGVASAVPHVSQPPATELFTPPTGLSCIPQQEPQEQLGGQCDSTPSPAQPLKLPLDSPDDGQFTLDGIEFSPQVLDMSLTSPFCAQLDEYPTGVEQVKGAETPNGVGSDGEEGVAKVIESAVARAEYAAENEAKSGLMRDYNYNELEDIVQLDGASGGGSSSSEQEQEEEEEACMVGEDEFLGMINAEALKALQEVDGSSGCSTSSSDSEPVEEMPEVEEEDPLNSGDDVSEQDVPDLFDTDNVVVCQYDKIHRSKNRWKFYLKDGVICFGGKDYVFSKAVGEAEW